MGWVALIEVLGDDGDDSDDDDDVIGVGDDCGDYDYRRYHGADQSHQGREGGIVE